MNAFWPLRSLRPVPSQRLGLRVVYITRRALVLSFVLVILTLASCPAFLLPPPTRWPDTYVTAPHSARVCSLSGLDALSRELLLPGTYLPVPARSLIPSSGHTRSPRSKLVRSQHARRPCLNGTTAAPEPRTNAIAASASPAPYAIPNSTIYLHAPVRTRRPCARAQVISAQARRAGRADFGCTLARGGWRCLRVRGREKVPRPP